MRKDNSLQDKETEKMEKWLKTFNKKFGFDAYDEILKELSRLFEKIEDLKKSRDLWRKKYEELKNG